MNIKGFAVALVAGLSITTAANAGVTVQNSDFLSSAGNSFNGFEGLSSSLYSGSTAYVEGGIKVQYFGSDSTIYTTQDAVGQNSWTPYNGGNGYTKISLANGGDFSAIEFLAGTTNWNGGSKLQYQLFNNGSLISSGVTGSLGNVNSSLKTLGFLGTNGTVFDELRVQNIFGNSFDAGESDRLILDNITIKSAGIGSAVPEPATWAMMIVGFGAVGSMARSSRRRLALATA